MVDDPLGLAQFEDKYRLAMELFEVRMLLEPDVAAVACQKATEEDKKRIKSLCDEVEQLYLSGQNHIKKDMEVLIPIILTAITTFANLTHRKLINETIDTHRAITDAILSGDTMGAKCAMIMHLTYNRQTIIDMSEQNKTCQTS